MNYKELQKELAQDLAKIIKLRRDEVEALEVVLSVMKGGELPATVTEEPPFPAHPPKPKAKKAVKGPGRRKLPVAIRKIKSQLKEAAGYTAAYLSLQALIEHTEVGDRVSPRELANRANIEVHIASNGLSALATAKVPGVHRERIPGQASTFGYWATVEALESLYKIKTYRAAIAEIKRAK